MGIFAPHSGLRIQNSHIFYMDTEKKMYVSIGVYPFSSEIHLKYEHFMAPVIHLRYRRISPDSPTPTPNNSPKNRTSAVKKVKERTIADALDSVKVWRQLYDQYDAKGKRLYNL